MKQPIRYFSIGLLTAGVVLLLAFYFFDTSETNTDNLATDEMIDAIKTEGYHVVTEDEYIAMSVSNEKDTKKNSNENEEKKKQNKTSKKNKKKADENTDQEESKKTDTYTINIQSGMLPSEISDILAENNIIKDASKFNEYLEENDLSPYIQLGKHKLNGDMSNEEVAKVLTK